MCGEKLGKMLRGIWDNTVASPGSQLINDAMYDLIYAKQ